VAQTDVPEVVMKRPSAAMPAETPKAKGRSKDNGFEPANKSGQSVF
jgi:hypothetical protein